MAFIKIAHNIKCSNRLSESTINRIVEIFQINNSGYLQGHFDFDCASVVEESKFFIS